MGETTPATEIATVEQSPRANGLQNVRVVQHPMPLLDTGMFEHMQRIATTMAEASLIPDSVRKGQSPREVAANCFLIVEQAVRWGVSPFALAQHAYFVHNKLGFEGKVIAALVNADSRIKGRLEYEYSGKEGTPERTVKVRGTFVDSGKVVEISGTVAKWATNNENWRKNPDQMLAYRGAREWARRYMPDKLMGVYSDDEIEDMALRAKDVTPSRVDELSDAAYVTSSRSVIAAPKGPPPPPPKPAKREEVEAPQAPAPAEEKPAEEPKNDPFAHPDYYINHLDGELAAAPDKATLDEVWMAHLEASDGRLSSEHERKCDELYERHQKRVETGACK